MDESRDMGHYLAGVKKNSSDNETHILDSTNIRVHQHAWGAMGRNSAKQAIGKNAAGWSTKIYVVTDALGLPLHFFITVGQRHDSDVAKGLLNRSSCQNVLMDGAYDSKSLRDFLAFKHQKATIPFRKNSLYPDEFDKDLYKERHLIECLFCHMKNYRRIATRYEKLASNFNSMIILSFILIWLRF
jgi:transposase